MTTEGDQPIDEGVVYELLMQEAEVAWATPVGQHKRTALINVDQGTIMTQKICEGSNQAPTSVDIQQIKGKLKIIGKCVPHCGAGLTWDSIHQAWIVDDGISGLPSYSP